MQHETHAKPSVVTIEGSVSGVQSLRTRTAATTESDHSDGLTDRQRLFVDAYCGGELPGNAQAAAIAAGYAESGAANMASRNLLNDKVQSEIERRVKMGRGTALLLGTQALFDMIEDGKDERAIVSAAIAVLDRFGMAPPKGGPLIDNRTINVIQPGEASAVLRMVEERAAARRVDHAKPSHPILDDV